MQQIHQRHLLQAPGVPSAGAFVVKGPGRGRRRLEFPQRRAGQGRAGPGDCGRGRSTQAGFLGFVKARTVEMLQGQRKQPSAPSPPQSPQHARAAGSAASAPLAGGQAGEHRWRVHRGLPGVQFLKGGGNSGFVKYFCTFLDTRNI